MIQRRSAIIPLAIGLAVSSWLLALSGCVTAPVAKKAPPSVSGTGKVRYHKVAKGETLWRIARDNGSDVDELVELNHLSGSARLEVGQQLIVPDVKTASAEAVQQDDFIWPVKGTVVSYFRSGSTSGINIQPGQRADVVASRSGKVVFLDDDFIDLGKTVIIEHAGDFWTVYARNADVYVALGQQVQRGTPIAKAGQAGRDKNTYLHFEIRKGNRAVNPLFYLP